MKMETKRKEEKQRACLRGQMMAVDRLDPDNPVVCNRGNPAGDKT